MTTNRYSVQLTAQFGMTGLVYLGHDFRGRVEMGFPWPKMHNSAERIFGFNGQLTQIHDRVWQDCTGIDRLFCKIISFSGVSKKRC